MNRFILPAIVMVGIGCVLPAAYAEDQVDELTVYGTDRSVITGSALADTREAAPTAKIEKSELQAGVDNSESQLKREDGRLEKPKLDSGERAKPDVTPNVQYQMGWKLILLFSLLESPEKSPGK